MGHRHKNSLNMVTVPSTTVSLSLAVWVLCRGLKQGQGVCVSKLLRHVCAHLDGLLEVTLVPNYDPGYLGAQCMLLAFLNPGWEAAEAGSIGNIVDEHNSMHIAVVVLHHGLPEALLTCSVPQLDLWGDSVEMDQMPNTQTNNELHLLTGRVATMKQ